ncbi:hypothetical protein [Stenomitos frigidus]|uniref:Late competence development ComFB family protein n=1 Tax=Stenomitos frigidus ULC18 TaxID=2107698 RepID=A0A2T1ELN3_9CYAN|nr:hypothetical protein [Stenomitos frigidus]PSB33660.1 hypothetical protein C7B82_04025 [Stenomitos frigidus ULC18]
MSHGLINLTLPTVIQEIEDVLEEYPHHPYHVAFSIHELRQKLIAHVLSHIPNHYTVEGVQESTSNLKNRRRTSVLAERLNTEMIIRAGILHILRENADWLSHNLPKL